MNTKQVPSPPHPTRLFWVPVLLSVDHVKINGDIHTDQESQEEEEEDEVEAEAAKAAAAVCWQVTVVHLKRGAPLFLGTSINIVPNTSNKTGMKSLPRSLCCF